MTQLMEAVHIDGDAVISFRGDGPARFRIQHTRDDHGEPDALGCAIVRRCRTRTSSRRMRSTKMAALRCVDIDAERRRPIGSRVSSSTTIKSTIV
jgi:hypothetical protein